MCLALNWHSNDATIPSQLAKACVEPDRHFVCLTDTLNATITNQDLDQDAKIMETRDIVICKESILAVLAEARLESREFPLCEYYSAIIGSIAFGVVPQKGAANFLTRLCALRSSTEMGDTQFSCPGTTWNELELADSQLDVLVETVGEITNPELQSRIYDVLWIRRRYVNDARNAAQSYIDAGEVCMNKGMPDAGKRLARGMMLATTIKDHQLIQTLGRRVEVLISTAHQ